MSVGRPLSAPVVAILGLVVLTGIALAVRGPSPGAASILAQAREALAAGLPDQAHARAAEVLLRDPGSVEALEVLAAVAVARDDLDSARALHQQVAQRSRRALASHAWLAGDLGARGDVDGALVHIDLLLRSHVDLREALYPALAQLLDTPGGIQALARLLGEGPTWRAALLQHLGREASASDALVALYGLLDTSAHPPTPAERRPLLQRLVGEGRYRQAWLLFVNSLDEAGLAQLGNLFNGGFEFDSSGLPFDWQFGRVAGAVIEQVESVDDDGDRSRRLRIEFRNRRVAFNHVGQLLVLDPGEYRLDGRVRLESLANERGLQWVIHCADAPRTELARSERFNGTRAWGRFHSGFTVPEEGCQAQWLRLQIPARIDSERQVSGRAWFDDLVIRRREQ